MTKLVAAVVVGAILSIILGIQLSLTVTAILVGGACLIIIADILDRIAKAQERQAHALEVLAKITTHSIDGRM